jgi:TolB-like protein
MAEGRVRRRLAAILAADVVGYSRLMEADEVETRARLRTLQSDLIEPKIAADGGRVVNTSGDGLLVEFESAVDAVHSALAVQRALQQHNAALAEDRRIEFRVGINLGDVIVEDDDIHGDGVNVAARLEGLCGPGEVYVSATVHDHVEGKLAAAFDDLGEQSVKNIARLVRVYRVREVTGEPIRHEGVDAPPTLPDKPSIAVLPFENMSGDPEQEYFADGISEDITTGLSKLRWFFVIARNSSFAYRGTAIDVRRVARELGVHYILEGSVRKSGNRVRINAQLIDASTGNHIWADRYDGDLTDIFALQDEITNKVVAAIEPRLIEAEGIRSQGRSPEDLGAWDLVIQANSLFWRMTKTESEAAIALLNRAVERYPDYAPAQSMLAFMLLVSGNAGWTLSELEPQVKQAEKLAARAAELDDGDPWSHLALGYVAFTRRHTDEAAEQFKRAIFLNPNFAAAHGYLGWALSLDGQSDAAISHLEEAIRMSPHDPQNAIFYVGLAAANYLADRYTDAIGFGRKAVQQRYGFTGGHRIYVASLAQAGQMDEARAALARLKELQPNLSVAWIENYVPYTPGPMAKFLEGMRMAGLD